MTWQARRRGVQAPASKYDSVNAETKRAAAASLGESIEAADTSSARSQHNQQLEMSTRW